MIEVMDNNGNINSVIDIKINNTLILNTRAHEVMSALLDLQANGVLSFDTRSVHNTARADVCPD